MGRRRMHRTVVLNVVGMTPRLIGAAMPKVAAWAADGAMARSTPPPCAIITTSALLLAMAADGAITVLVLSGPVVTCRKNTRCTPICAMAKTTSATGMPGPQIRPVCGAQNDAAVSSTASARPMR